LSHDLDGKSDDPLRFLSGSVLTSCRKLTRHLWLQGRV
jgi:hypothetical protein